MHNKQLAEQRKIPQEHRNRIDDIHIILEGLLKPENRSSDTYHKIEELENELQDLVLKWRLYMTANRELAGLWR